MPSPDQLARAGVEAILRAFERYEEQFGRITRRARRRFEERDWAAGQLDAIQRLGLYRRVVDGLVREMGEILGASARDPAVWKGMKALHAEALEGQRGADLAETFFNSLTRRVFATVGVDPEIEYVDLDPRRHRYGPLAIVYRTHVRHGTTRAVVAELLRATRFGVPFAALERDAERVAEEIDAAWRAAGAVDGPERVELLEPVFYRGSAAYLVGRIAGGETALPLVLVLVHEDAGIAVDAVLLSEREVSIVFSYTRSHFHAEVDHPGAVIRFLRALMPQKRVADL